jgi:hypothetical protein
MQRTAPPQIAASKAHVQAENLTRATDLVTHILDIENVGDQIGL